MYARAILCDQRARNLMNLRLSKNGRGYHIIQPKSKEILRDLFLQSTSKKSNQLASCYLLYLKKQDHNM